MSDRHEDTRLCQGIDLHITDSLNFYLIDENMVLGLLQEHMLDPVGLPLDQVRLDDMESVLLLHPLIGKADCYMTGGDLLRINISGKVPFKLEWLFHVYYICPLDRFPENFIV